jgi:hypothetical protein
LKRSIKKSRLCSLTAHWPKTQRPKKLNELRPRRELKQMKLQSLRDRVGLKDPALTQVQVTELEREAAELEESIQASTAEEAQIFRGGGGRGLEVTRRLAELRAERQAKADKLTIIRSQLCSHEDAFRAKPAEAEVRQEVDLVIGELIRRREATASRLLDNLCNPAWRDSGLVWRFRSVQEVSTLRRASYSDPSEAHALLNRLRALSEIEPLAEVLRVCEQKQMSAGEIAEVVQA